MYYQSRNQVIHLDEDDRELVHAAMRGIFPHVPTGKVMARVWCDHVVQDGSCCTMWNVPGYNVVYSPSTSLLEAIEAARRSEEAMEGATPQTWLVSGVNSYGSNPGAFEGEIKLVPGRFGYQVDGARVSDNAYSALCNTDSPVGTVVDGRTGDKLTRVA